MKEIIQSIKDFSEAITTSAGNLFSEPIFWLVLFVFCILLFMNSKSKSKSIRQQRSFVKGAQKMINSLTDIFLDLFNSIFDVVGVVLNFIKELNSLLFGSLNISRVHRLAAFGVIFFSFVSFWTTAQGLESFVGLPFNYLISFGIQSAILIVNFKIIKDYKQRKEIKKQILKNRVNDNEIKSDSFFSWSNSLRVRFKRCLNRAEKIEKLTSKYVDQNTPKATDLSNAVKKLTELFKTDSKILELFENQIDLTQLNGNMKDLFNKMEKAAKSTQNEDVRKKVVEQWISNEFEEIKQKIENAIDSSDDAKRIINPILSEISNQLNEIKPNWHKLIMMPMIIRRDGSNWFARILNEETAYKNVEAYRYSSGKIQEFYKRRHFLGLALVLAIFIFLSSTFSYTFVYNTMYKDKQVLENYHMTMKLCDDAIVNYQKNILLMSNNSKDELNKFIKKIESSSTYKSSVDAYLKYYNDESELINLEKESNELTGSDANTMARIKTINSKRSETNTSKNENGKEKVLYAEYIAFIESFSRTPFSTKILSEKSAPVAPQPSDYDNTNEYIQMLKEYDLASTIWLNKGLVATTENIISQLSFEYDNENWSEVRDRALVYQKIYECDIELQSFQKDRQAVLDDNSLGDDGKSAQLLKITSEFTDNILSSFASINQKDVVSFCENMYLIKNNINDQERFISEKTADVEKAGTMLFSRFVPTGMPLFCWFISVLIDFSIFVILFIRGIKNSAHLLDKQKVLIAKLLLNDGDNQKKETIPPHFRSIIIISTLIISIVLTFFTGIPIISNNKEWMFFAIWFVLYVLIISIVNLIKHKNFLKDDESEISLKQQNMLINKYYSHLIESLLRDFTNPSAQINHCKKYKALLISEFSEYELQILDDFRMLESNISKNYFANTDDVIKYVNNLQTDLIRKIYENAFEDYFNDICLDFLQSLEPSDTKEYGGFNYLFHKALDKCNDREKLFSIFYESLYPTLLYIPYKVAVNKGLDVFLKLLIAEDLAHLDNENVYISPLFFRLLDEILYLKMLDNDFDFTDDDDIDTDLSMDDVVEAYVEAKYLNSQE